MPIKIKHLLLILLNEIIYTNGQNFMKKKKAAALRAIMEMITVPCIYMTELWLRTHVHSRSIGSSRVGEWFDRCLVAGVVGYEPTRLRETAVSKGFKFVGLWFELGL